MSTLLTIEFLVQGSADEPYRVTFRKGEGSLSAYCTCPAGEVRQYCKHRTRILRGDITDIASSNCSEAEIVASWMPGSNLERAFRNVEAAEIAVENAKRDLASAKRALARVMHD